MKSCNNRPPAILNAAGWAIPEQLRARNHPQLRSLWVSPIAGLERGLERSQFVSIHRLTSGMEATRWNGRAGNRQGLEQIGL
jgi:hypothetical protein